MALKFFRNIFFQFQNKIKFQDFLNLKIYFFEYFSKVMKVLDILRQKQTILPLKYFLVPTIVYSLIRPLSFDTKMSGLESENEEFMIGYITIGNEDAAVDLAKFVTHFFVGILRFNFVLFFIIESLSNKPDLLPA